MICNLCDFIGQIVSGVVQEQKNIDLRIEKGRGNLFGMLGPAFSFKCLLSPIGEPASNTSQCLRYHRAGGTAVHQGPDRLLCPHTVCNIQDLLRGVQQRLLQVKLLHLHTDAGDILNIG